MSTDVGRQALALGVGALNVTFYFERPSDAKKAWEKIRDRCDGISVNRVAAQTWSPGEPVPDVTRCPQMVIAAGEDEPAHRPQIEKARRFMRACRGREVTPPLELVTLTAANRARNMALNGGKLQMHRAPQGKFVTADGETLGYVVGGQG